MVMPPHLDVYPGETINMAPGTYLACVEYSTRWQVNNMSMLAAVNDEVSEGYTQQGAKQCPSPVFHLRGKVWFYKYTAK